MSQCGSLKGDLGSQASLKVQLYTPAIEPGEISNLLPSESSGEHNDFIFTLQEQDDDGNVVCSKVEVRVSSNLPPVAAVETDFPWSNVDGIRQISAVDYDRNGHETLNLKGLCADPEGRPIRACYWSDDDPVTEDWADPDPNTFGSDYSVTISRGSNRLVSLNAVDDQGSTNSFAIYIRVQNPVDTDPRRNSPPVCQGATVSLLKDTVWTVDPGLADSEPRCADPEGAALAYSVTQPVGGNGTATGGNGLRYSPPTGFTGVEEFSFQACDPAARCTDPVGVRIEVRDRMPELPLSPGSAQATLRPRRGVRIVWEEVDTATRYEVQRCQDGTAGYVCTTIASAVPPGTTEIDSAANRAGTYRFKVRACNPDGCSDWVSAPDLALP